MLLNFYNIHKAFLADTDLDLITGEICFSLKTNPGGYSMQPPAPGVQVVVVTGLR